MHAVARSTIPSEPDRLLRVDGAHRLDAALIAAKLRDDSVVLVRDLSLQQAERLICGVTARLGLSERLGFQAAYADSSDRERVGQYNVTVNKRSAYQFIQAHSEGNSLINVQLASFYCLANSTDGGETLLFNVDDSIDGWPFVRERAVKIAPEFPSADARGVDSSPRAVPSAGAAFTRRRRSNPRQARERDFRPVARGRSHEGAQDRSSILGRCLRVLGQHRDPGL